MIRGVTSSTFSSSITNFDLKGFSLNLILLYFLNTLSYNFVHRTIDVANAVLNEKPAVEKIFLALHHYRFRGKSHIVAQYLQSFKDLQSFCFFNVVF